MCVVGARWWWGRREGEGEKDEGDGGERERKCVKK